MRPYRNDSISIDEYFQIRENSEALLEYIDGTVYMLPSPSTKHQRISSKLQIKFGNFLEGKSCELFPAPYDIELKKENMEGSKLSFRILALYVTKMDLQVPDMLASPA